MGVTQWVLIGLIVLMLIAYPLLMSKKNKAANQKMEEQTNSLKRGDEILTTAGVYGKVLEVKQEGDAKKVVIETGNEKNKSYLTIDAYSIYAVLNKEPVKEPLKADDKKEAKPEEKKTDAKAVDQKAGVKSEEKKSTKTEEKISEAKENRTATKAEVKSTIVKAEKKEAKQNKK